jgi:uncharacterized protein
MGDITTADKVDFLSSPAAYPGLVGPVDVEETHMSWVFLAGERVYKLKKPVRYPFLDFTTIEAREANCREEVRLNLRLAPEVYLGVVALSVSAGGALALGDDGEIVDWLVEMRRLPAERMLDKAIASGDVSRESICAVAHLLCGFYESAAREELSGAEYVEQFAHEQAINREVLSNRDFDLDRPRVESALRTVEDMLERSHRLVRRAEAGRIVEGHGDLRPEHVCLSEPPAIIDCLEFSRRLRLVDPLDELVFLDLECQRLQAGWIGRLIIDTYAERTKDHPDDELMSFYRAYRACLRARLSLVHIIESDTRSPWKWLPQARHYIALATTPAVSRSLRQAR